MKPIKITLVGYKGKMGKCIEDVISSSKSVWLFSKVDIGDDLDNSSSGADVIIDFSSPKAVQGTVAAGIKNNIPVVIGTTGISKEEEQIIKNASSKIAIVYAPNMSVGVNTILSAIKNTAQVLGTDYKIDIVEEHHIHKKDRPSGTAKKILETVEAAMDNSIEVRTYEETMPPREKSNNNIRVLSIRKGETIGEHEITFTGNGEVVKISHSAMSREVFAGGACRAAVWVVGKPAGLYDMKDVLGL